MLLMIYLERFDEITVLSGIITLFHIFVQQKILCFYFPILKSPQEFICNKMKDFIEHFKRLTKVSDDLEKEIRSKSLAITVNKGDFLHNATSVCKKTYWIQKGLLRTYYLKDGKEITDVFASEGDWITSVKSFMKNEPDHNYLQAIENSEVYALCKDDLMLLFENIPEMERFGRITMSIYYSQLSEKLESYQFTSAKDKYVHFCKVYDSILNRLPLGMVASYFGITQETLSRIRKEA